MSKLIIIFLVLVIPVPISALSIQTHAEVGIDTSIIKEDNSYSAPNKVVVAPIFKPENFSSTFKDWYLGTYYYLVSNEMRSGFTDVPFHYVVTSDGQVFPGNIGRDERKVSVQDYGTDLILIYYFADTKESSFSIKSQEQLKLLIMDVMNTNIISPNRLDIIGVSHVKEIETNQIKLVENQLYGLWESSFKSVENYLKSNYKPKARSYDISVANVSTINTTLFPGETTTVKLEVTNNGETGIYAGGNGDLFATTRSASRFYYDDVWANTAQVGLLDEGQNVLPGEKVAVDFEVYIPLYFGKQKESFTIFNSLGQELADSSFSIELDIKRPDGQIVEVTATDTGFLRVRSAPNGFLNNEIARVSPGQRYFLLETTANGWAKIKLTDGREGWVSQAFIRNV